MFVMFGKRIIFIDVESASSSPKLVSLHVFHVF